MWLARQVIEPDGLRDVFDRPLATPNLPRASFHSGLVAATRRMPFGFTIGCADYSRIGSRHVS